MTYARRHDSISSAKWWLSAGCCGLIVTLSFVGVTLFLGMNGRQEYSSPIIREYQRKNQNILSSFPPPLPPRPPSIPVITEKKQTPITVSETPTVRLTEQGYVERSFKTSNRAKIEMVRPSDILTPKSTEPPTRIDIPIPEEIPPKHEESEDHSRHYTENRNYSGELAEKPDEKPKETDLDDSFGAAVDKSSSDKTSTIKKSEAIYPDWFEPDAMASSLPVVEQSRNNAQEEFYNKPVEIPDFSYFKDLPVPYQFQQENDNSIKPEVTKENPVLNFLRKKVQDVHDWLNKGGVSSKEEWMDLLDVINSSITERNVSLVISKLKEMYNETNGDIEDVPVSSILYPTDPGLNPVSFGLLAVDLFLLHNVQQIAWSEQESEGEKMLQDPDILALNALFLPPDSVLQLRTTGKTTPVLPRNGQGIIQDLLDLLSGGLRAVLNLTKAYRNSRSQNRPAVSPLDCVWTLYCRNLEKTARMQGPYGFLAKMNRLGLRLLMGEFPAENALDHLVKEVTQGWEEIKCEKLFPRCSAEDAKNVVFDTAMGGAVATPSSRSTSKTMQ